MKLTILIAALLTLSCASETIMVHPTKSHQDFDRDSTDCEVKQHQAGKRLGTNFYDQCMSGLGWEEQDAK